MSTPKVPLPLLTIGLALGIATACCSTPSPSASTEPAPTADAGPDPAQTPRDMAALGAWHTGAADNGIHAFVWDGEHVTLWLLTEKAWMWRTPDDHYRVRARWTGDTLEYQPPFGRWETLANWSEGRFAGYERLDPSGPLTDTQRQLLTPRAPHNYDVKPTDEPAWRQAPPRHEWWPGLSVRDGDKLVDASEADVAVARNYPKWLDKGVVTRDMRVSISTARVVAKVGQPVRVLHVLEVLGQEKGSVYVMGPKPAFQEYVDGTMRTAAPVVPDYPWVGIYDGRVLDAPNLDYNWDVTEYRFETPGTHTIQWRPSATLVSNTLTITVVP